MGLGVMLVVEAEFGIGNAVRRRADVGADAGGVGLEREHVEVAHHLHVLAAFVALGNLDLDGRRIGGVAFARRDAGLLQRGLLLAILDGGDATFHGAHAVEVFVELVLVVLRAVSGAGPWRRRGPDRASAIERVRLCASLCQAWSVLPKSRLSTLRGFDLGGDGLRRRAEAAVRIVPFVQPLLVLLVRLRHRGQFQRRQRGEAAHVVGGDLVRGNRDVDLVPRVRIRQLRREPSRQLERVRCAIERSDRNARDALHQQALVEHGPQRFQGRRRRRQKALRIRRPELIHDDAMRHVHEPKADRWFDSLALA